MMSRQLTWYNNLTSEEETVTTRDVEPFVVCSDKVQFIDPSYEVDLLPNMKRTFLPPRKKKPSQDKPSNNRRFKTFTTLHKGTVDKPYYSRR
jgi:hypothetical protein